MKTYIGIRVDDTGLIYEYKTKEERKELETLYGSRNCKVFTTGHESELYEWTGTDIISKTDKQIKQEKEKEKQRRKNQLKNNQINASAELAFIELIDKYKEKGVSLLSICLSNELEYIVPISSFYKWDINKEIRNTNVSSSISNDKIEYQATIYLGNAGYGFTGINEIYEGLNKFKYKIRKECERNNEQYKEEIYEDAVLNTIPKAIKTYKESQIEYINDFIFIDKTYIEDEGELEIDEENVSINLNQIACMRPCISEFNTIITNAELIKILNKNIS